MAIREAREKGAVVEEECIVISKMRGRQYACTLMKKMQKGGRKRWCKTEKAESQGQCQCPLVKEMV